MRTWEHCKNMENALSHSVKTIQAYIKSVSHTHSPMRIKCVRVRWENKPTSTEQRMSANTSDCERLSVWVECVWLCVFLSVFVSDSVCLCVREGARMNQLTSLLTCAHPTPIKITYCKHRLKFPSYLYLTHDGKNIIRPTRSTYSLVISFFELFIAQLNRIFKESTFDLFLVRVNTIFITWEIAWKCYKLNRLHAHIFSVYFGIFYISTNICMISKHTSYFSN